MVRKVSRIGTLAANRCVRCPSRTAKHRFSADVGGIMNRLIHAFRRLTPAAMVAIAACVLGTTSAQARTPPATSTWEQPDESDLTSHGHYVNRDGKDVHSPSKTRDNKVPPGATARCRDGSYSFSRHRSGTCSRHGGVAEWE